MPSRPQILVVDDDPDAVAIAQINLELNGYGVTTASDGVEALDSLNSNPQDLPDLILLNTAMPRLDGWQVMNALADDDRMTDVPVVMTSADTPERHVKRAMAAGAWQFLSKPFPPASLLELVTAAVAPPADTDPT